MLKTTVRFASILAMLLGYIGCVHRTPVEAPESVSLGNVNTIEITAPVLEATAAKIVATGTSPLMLLGEADNRRASILIKFTNFPDSGEVVSAKLTMINFKSIGDSTGQFEASAHAVLEDWKESLVTFENFNRQFDPEELARATVTPADSDTVVFEFDPALIAGWRDSSITNNGIYIQPHNATFLSHLISRNSLDRIPVLRIGFKPIAGQDSVATWISLPTQDAFIFERLAPINGGWLYAADGEDYRSILKFDLSAIPKSATISRATLTLTVDSLNSFLAKDDGYVFDLYRLTEDSDDPLTAALDSSRAINKVSVNVTSASKTLGIDIRSQVQQWTFGNQFNFGMLLLSRRPERELYRAAFYSTAQDSAKAPKITITYTVPPTIQN